MSTNGFLFKNVEHCWLKKTAPALPFPAFMLMHQNCLKAPKKQQAENAVITFISFKSMPLLGFGCNEIVCFDILQQKLDV